ncbi:MAG: DNA polymerase III subunit delta' [Nitrospinaceae bacterium]|nr:DNA polymerase III subunit delta' [Nitrospinaceae bacterium]NIR55961.1 DNA polymerase III subunit delta' [Nitrospinaceae bacterium]NIS86404.1 DNA polymerase III subunit delta' [Nitrospinaceae bacterium]NIT83242.1 DNA polymerase III subunit delta' [Nitrospinaceae bacterium]NIU45449.1 DNA polymerase III subunit delta' [Nitrospinaceae bacterium]
MSIGRILGQGQAKHILSRALSHSRLSHAYLFYGPESIGKKQLALEFAKALNCTSQGPEEACDLCESCRKTDARIHPDFFFLEPTKTTPAARDSAIRIEAIRDLQKKLGFLPYEGRFKAVVIDQVDKMNPQACNAFLKTLEEPPSATVLFLITSNPRQLLPTILSRCQGIKFNPLPPEAIKQILEEQEEWPDLDAGEVEIRVARSKGQVARALSDEVTQTAGYRQDLIALLDQLSWERMDLLFQWAKTLAKGSEPLAAVLEEMMGLLRDITLLKSGGAPDQLFNRDLMPALEPVARKKTLTGLLKMIDAVAQTQMALSGNANAQLALENMLMEFCEAA